jgi:hypothetical protein
VRADPAGRPTGVRWRGRWVAVTSINDTWRIDDEWWRKEISRLYFQIILAGDRPLIVFHDLIGGGWYAQSDIAQVRAAASLRALVPADARRPARAPRLKQDASQTGVA